MENEKELGYQQILEQLDSFFNKYNDGDFKLCDQAKMTSIVSLIKNNIPSLFFVGFYIVVDVLDQKENHTGQKYLEVGPYQSTILATPRIGFGKGQCGQAWQEQKTQIVDDVSECKNYIACDKDTKSEIVVPVFNKNQEVISVLDIDSTQKAFFSQLDKNYLEQIVQYMLK